MPFALDDFNDPNKQNAFHEALEREQAKLALPAPEEEQREAACKAASVKRTRKPKWAD